MNNEATPRLRRAWWLGVFVWWALLGWQTWHAWDLSERIPPCCLQVGGPESPFAVLGIVLGLLGAVRGGRVRAWLRVAFAVPLCLVAAWVLVDAPVSRYGTTLYVWRHEAEFLQQVVAAREQLARGGELSDWPGPDAIFVEGDPPRFGFAQRWVGMFHWAAIVHDPDRTLARDRVAGRLTVFHYSRIGLHHLYDDWYVVTAMK